MKLYITILIFLFIGSRAMFSQESKSMSNGKVLGKVYFNYHFNNDKNTDQKGAFELTRVYLGYNYKFNDKFSSRILLDAGKNIGGSAYTIFVKNAKLDFQANNWLKLTAGIFSMVQFKVQEDFWGYRYLYKSLEDEYKFGTSADVGVMAGMKVSNHFHIDLLAVNGEGYRNLQDASGYNRYGINFIYKPDDNLILKAYFDYMNGIDILDDSQITTVTNMALFAGYRFNTRFRIAGEYNLMKNAIAFNLPADGRDLQGISIYSSYIINNKWNVFGRYDLILSNEILIDEPVKWNFEEDGGTVIAGFEYKPIKGVNTSINYRHKKFAKTSIEDISFLYFNLEFYF